MILLIPVSTASAFAHHCQFFHGSGDLGNQWAQHSMLEIRQRSEQLGQQAKQPGRLQLLLQRPADHVDELVAHFGIGATQGNDALETLLQWKW